MQLPIMLRKTRNAEVAALIGQRDHLLSEVQKAQAESAQWRVQYRTIRDRIVDLATNERATPQFRAALVEFTRFPA